MKSSLSTNRRNDISGYLDWAFRTNERNVTSDIRNRQGIRGARISIKMMRQRVPSLIVSRSIRICHQHAPRWPGHRLNDRDKIQLADDLMTILDSVLCSETMGVADDKKYTYAIIFTFCNGFYRFCRGRKFEGKTAHMFATTLKIIREEANEIRERAAFG